MEYLLIAIVLLCSLLNRLRGTGVIKHFGTLTILNKQVDIKFNGNHLYGLIIATILGVVVGLWLGLAVFVAYIIGEANGWGEWVGSLTRHEPWDEQMLQHNYKDEEGKTFPFIHQIANSIIHEKIEGTFESRVEQYKNYATLALFIRGFYWWGMVYFTLAIFGIISYEVAMMISLLLGMAFPIACEIGKRITFTRTYDLKFIKLSFSQGWENQEVVYGIFQGIALWYTIIFLICYN